MNPQIENRNGFDIHLRAICSGSGADCEPGRAVVKGLRTPATALPYASISTQQVSTSLHLALADIL
jgi:hypothetical protein